MKKHLTPDVMSDAMARVIICGLFGFLSINLLRNFSQTGHITSLFLLVSEALVAVLTIVRRRASMTDRTPISAITTAVSVVGPTLLRASVGGGLVVDGVTAAVSMAGLSLVILGKLTLGRSFGIAPANRGVVARGPYMLMRHPIYTGYILTHLAFLVANPTGWNLALIVASDVTLIVRALREERVLGTDDAYRMYCQRVGWHLVPGVF
jgi:protein-S-isoprenylcysteine O-methyltransferase Ste14